MLLLLNMLVLARAFKHPENIKGDADSRVDSDEDKFQSNPDMSAVILSISCQPLLFDWYYLDNKRNYNDWRNQHYHYNVGNQFHVVQWDESVETGGSIAIYEASYRTESSRAAVHAEHWQQDHCQECWK